ncbi:psmD13, partial [Symbiodinium microadriaticum]
SCIAWCHLGPSHRPTSAGNGLRRPEGPLRGRRGRMDVDPSPALEAQRKAHPELSEQLDKMQKFVNSKLYHQLTQTLLEYLVSPPFAAATPAVAAELKDFFEGFIKAFEVRFDKVRWVQILSIVAKPQTPAVALELIAPFEATMAENRDAKFLCQALKGEKLILSADTESAKELLENLGVEIDNAYEVQALIQSHFHKTNALLWKTLGRSQEFYKSSILYLAFTPLEAIPMEERPQIAFDTVIAALVAEEEFNFGELTQQAIIQSLDGSPFAWVRDLLQAFSEGKFDLFDAAIAKNRAQMEASPELKSAEATLRRKMCALSLMELAFRKPKKQRRLSFSEIAQHCRVLRLQTSPAHRLQGHCRCAQLFGLQHALALGPFVACFCGSRQQS